MTHKYLWSCSKLHRYAFTTWIRYDRWTFSKILVVVLLVAAEMEIRASRYISEFEGMSYPMPRMAATENDQKQINKMIWRALWRDYRVQYNYLQMVSYPHCLMKWHLWCSVAPPQVCARNFGTPWKGLLKWLLNSILNDAKFSDIFFHCFFNIKV